jgi:chromosome segregation ATPase
MQRSTDTLPFALQSHLSHISNSVEAIIDEGAAALFPDTQSFDLRTSELEAQLECKFSEVNDRLRALAAVFLLATKCSNYQTIIAELAACKTAEMSLLSAEVDIRTASLVSAEADASALATEIADIRGDIDRLSSDISVVKGELAELIRAGLGESATLLDRQLQISSIDQQVADTLADISHLRDELKTRIAGQSSLRARSASLESLISLLDDELHQSESAIDEGSGDLSRELTELESILGANSDIQARIVSTGEAASHATDELVRLKGHIAGIRTQYRELEKRQTDLHLSLANGRNETEELSAELEDLQVVSDGLEVLTHKLRSDDDELGDRLRAAQEELEVVRAELEELRKRQHCDNATVARVPGVSILRRPPKIRRRDTQHPSQTLQLPSRLFPAFSISQPNFD